MPVEPRAATRAAKSDGTAGTAGAVGLDQDPAAALARVVSDVLPPLIGRLADSELGELEVAQNGWRVRLRREGGAPATGGSAAGPGGQAGAANHVVTSAGGTAHTTGGRASGSVSGSGHATAAATGGASAASHAGRTSAARGAALSPAVGYFTARAGLTTGQAVRAGDVLGAINVLGVTQPVVAPADGVIGRVLASAGEAVEYAQELIRIDGIERLAES